jgi:hypothetical protein
MAIDAYHTPISKDVITNPLVIEFIHTVGE